MCDLSFNLALIESEAEVAFLWSFVVVCEQIPHSKKWISDTVPA